MEKKKGKWSRLASKFSKTGTQDNAHHPSGTRTDVHAEARSAPGHAIEKHSRDRQAANPESPSTETQTTTETGRHNHNASPLAPSQAQANSFWTRGYLRKKADQPDLLLAFEALIADEASGGQKPIPAPASVLAGLCNRALGHNIHIQLQPSTLGNDEYFVCDSSQMARLVDSRLEQTKQTKEWKVPFSEIHIDLQSKVRSVVRGVLWAKEAITPSMSLEPHASIAWAGICLILPLLCSPLEQQDLLIEGVTRITSIMCRLTVCEKLYRSEYGGTLDTRSHDVKRLAERYEDESAGLLAEIIEFQARAVCRTCRGPLSEYAREIVKADDWKAMLQRIGDDDTSCEKLLRTLNEEKYEKSQRALEETLRSLDTTVRDLTDISKLTLKEVQAVSAKLNEQDIQNVLDALDVSIYEKHKRVIPKHVEGTCRWFTGHPLYESWKGSTTGVLWLAADPGCGKTVLSKCLVDGELRATSERATCYFFFRDGMLEQQGIERALCTLLHQLFTQRRGLIHHAFGLYKSAGKAMAKSADGLWNILVKATRDPAAGELILILDALDECEESDRKDLVERVARLFLPENGSADPVTDIDAYQLSNSEARGRTKFFLTSRPYHDINTSFQELIDKLPNVHLSADQETAAIRKEIDIVVDHRVTELAARLKFQQTTADMLADKLKAADNRTYLWLRLIFHAIEKKHGARKRDLEVLIESIPDTVQKAYADILGQCDDPSKARRIFQVLLASQVALTVQQLNVAVALSEAEEDIDDGHSDHGKDDIEIAPRDLFLEQMRYACGLFVSVIDDKVYFIHQTAREFLTMDHQKQRTETCIELPLNLPDCHYLMALACTSCLEVVDQPACDSSVAHLLPYAARYWHMHVAIAVLRDGGDVFEDIYERTLQTCREAAHQEVPKTSMQYVEAHEAAESPIVDESLGQKNHDLPKAPDSSGEANKSIAETGRGSNTVTFSEQDNAEVLCLALFGLAASLWLSCAQIAQHKRANTRQEATPMLQWALTHPTDNDDPSLRVQLWITESLSQNPEKRGKSLHKIFWEHSHFANLSQEHTSASKTSTSSNDLFAIAKRETQWLVNVIEEQYTSTDGEQPKPSWIPDYNASRSVLAEAFSVPAQSSRSIYNFQQYLQRAGSGGYLWEIECHTATEKVYLRGLRDQE